MPFATLRSMVAARVVFLRFHRFLIAGLVLLAALPCEAASSITKANNTNDLNATGSWVGGVVPSSGNLVIIDSTLTVARTTKLGGNVSFLGIQLTNPGGTFTINASTAGAILTLGSSGIDMSNATANLNIAANLSLAASQEWNVANGRTMTASGTMDASNGSLTVSGAGSVNLTGLISGAGGLTQNSTGTTTLSGANTYTGGTTVNSGTLSLGAASVFDSSSPVTVAGGTLNLNSHNETVGNVTLTNGTITGTGILTGTSFEVQNGTVSAIIDGSSATLLKTTSGSVSLTKANTFGGNTVIRDGTLQISGSNSALSTGIVTLGDSLTQSGDDLALLAIASGKTFANTITVSGYGNSSTIGGNFGSGTATFSGTVNVTGDTLLTSASGGTVNFTGNFSGAGNLTKVDLGTVTLNSATNDNALTGNVVIKAGTLSIAGGGALGDTSSVNVQSSGTLSVTASETTGSLEGSGNVTLSNGKILTIGDNNRDTTFSGVIGGGSATSGLTKIGTGTFTLNGTNTYTGITNTQYGTLRLDLSAGNNVLASTSKLTLGGGTFRIDGNSTAASTQTIGNPTLTAATSTSVVINANGGTSTTLTLGNTWTRGAGSTVNVDISAANSFLTNSPTLTNSVLGYATVTDATGTGFATVTSGNIARYTGASTLLTNSNSATTNYSTSGTVAMTNANRSVNSLAIDTSSSSGSLDLGGASNILTITSLGMLMTGSSNYTISDGQVGANNKEVIVHQMSTGTLTISGTVGSGTASLTKDGTGMLSLTGNNAFTGATVISGGTIQLAATGSNQALGSTSGITINTGGTLLFGSSNQINNSATVTLAGGTISMAGNSEGSSGATGLNTLTLSSNSTFDFGSTGSAVIYFADSSATAWTSGATIDVYNWNGSGSGGGNNQIFFGSTANGLTSTQIGDILFINPDGLTGVFAGQMMNSGELVAMVPAPEPSTYLAGAFLAGLLVIVEYRRRKQLSLA